MHKKYKILILQCAVFALFALSAIAQSPRSVACHLASDLKSGTLLVVLKTDAKKLVWLKKFSSEGTEKDKNKYLKQYNKTIAQRDSLWKYVTLGFGQLYRFSDVVFMMDTSMQTFLKNRASCHFYNEKLSPTNQTLKGKVFVCKYGQLFEDQGRNLLNAWYVMNDTLGRLSKPFPEVIKFSLFNPAFFFKLPKDFMNAHYISKVSERHRPLQYALKLNNELVKFYTKTGDCE